MNFAMSMWHILYPNKQLIWPPIDIIRWSQRVGVLSTWPLPTARSAPVTTSPTSSPCPPTYRTGTSRCCWSWPAGEPYSAAAARLSAADYAPPPMRSKTTSCRHRHRGLIIIISRTWRRGQQQRRQVGQSEPFVICFIDLKPFICIAHTVIWVHVLRPSWASLFATHVFFCCFTF